MIGLVLVILQIYASQATNPGVQIRISQPALDYVAQVAINQLSSGVRGTEIPDQSGDTDVAIGKVYYGLSGMKVTSFGSPNSQIVVNPGSITWRVTGVSISLHGDWHYKFKRAFIDIGDHGSFDISVSEVDFSISVTLGDTNWRPSIAETACSSHVGHVKVTFHGGQSWLYNIFDDGIEKNIKDQMNSMMCDAARKAVNTDAAGNLAKMKVKAALGPMTIDYSLIASPIIGKGYIESQHKGEIVWTSHATLSCLEPPPLPAAPSSPRMLTIWISDYIMNTLGDVAHRNGLLQTILRPENLPSDERRFLYATCIGTCIGDFIPILAKQYHGSYLEIEMATTSRPRMTVAQGVLTGVLNGYIASYIRTNISREYAFNMTVTVKCSLDAKMILNNITANIKSFKPRITVTDSKIGKISGNALTWLFSSVSNRFIVPQLNRVAHAGFELPKINDYGYVNPNITLTQDALLLTTDVKYHP